MTPPQAYWIRYAQTEVIEVHRSSSNYSLYSIFSYVILLPQHNCDPRFFTTVVFYKGSVSMATQLKFEVFDVYDRRESQMCPIGQSQCRVQDLVQAPNQQQRLEILFDGAVCGYLTVNVMKVRGRERERESVFAEVRTIVCMQICSLSLLSVSQYTH